MSSAVRFFVPAAVRFFVPAAVMSFLVLREALI